MYAGTGEGTQMKARVQCCYTVQEEGLVCVGE